MFAQKKQKPLPLGNKSIPEHIAVLISGSGNSTAIENLHGVLWAAADAGVKYLTLFSPDMEILSPPENEGQGLFGLVSMLVRSDVAVLHDSNIRFRTIGSRDMLAGATRELLETLENITAANTGLNLVIAVNYSGRGEILRAVQHIAAQVKAGEIGHNDACEELLAANLDTAGMPDPDLVVFTGGVSCTRNFLTWQSAYSEFLFTDTFWSDFSDKEIFAAITEFQGRSRRFGGLSAKACS